MIKETSELYEQRASVGVYRWHEWTDVQFEKIMALRTRVGRLG